MIYYGDEIGMGDLVTWKNFPQRSTMLWNDSLNAGFSANTTFTTSRMSSEYKRINFNRQCKSKYSRLNTIRRIIRIKKQNNVLKSGRTYIAKPFDETFSVIRYVLDIEGKVKGAFVIIITNFGPSIVNYSLVDLPPFHLSNTYSVGKVLAHSSNSRMRFKLGQTINIESRSFTLGPDEGVVLSIK
jgi:glycosidase